MSDVRVGVVGAGANTTARHIPLLQGIDGVEIVGVVNRSESSSSTVAKRFGIPKTYGHWEQAVADRDTNAILIGTWPYLHCPVTLAALDAGHFERAIAPYAGISTDEGPRRDTSREKMAELKTLVPGGVLTAAVASQISDGAAALLIASERAVKDHGLTPRARIHHVSVRGDDPVMMLSAPIPATQHALKKVGMSIDEIDLVEINEAFAPVVLAWNRELGADPAKVNPNGGAIALGHPIGCTGARLMTSLLHELERTGGRFGLQTMCEGGGQANVTIIERLG